MHHPLPRASVSRGEATSRVWDPELWGFGDSGSRVFGKFGFVSLGLRYPFGFVSLGLRYPSLDKAFDISPPAPENLITQP